MTEPQRLLRLPGSVAEIEASVPGPKVGAFFDLDGTLLAGFTASVHHNDRMRRREVGAREFVRTLQLGMSYQLGRTDFESLLTEGAKVMRGRLIGDLDQTGERLFQRKISDLIFPEMRELVRAHLLRGHTVVLSSSAMSVQVDPVARYLGIDNVLCNRFVLDEEGVLSGEVVRPIIWGPGKADAAQVFAAEYGLEMDESYFYADGDEDLALMYLVGHPRPTNPGKRLASVARKRGWPVLEFHSRGSGTGATLRSMAATAAIVPAAAGGLTVGLLRRNKRSGVNYLLSTWLKSFLQISGVHVNVVGAENLTAQRPAVFIFNHRNNFDAFIVGNLLDRDFTGVAKKELQKDPIFGTLGKLMDLAFVDRSDSKSAVEALKGIEVAAAKGLSIAVAPEGARFDTTGVGAFKKGAFRMAMAAGIPVVPIVIRNAELIAGKNAATVNPGTVDVAVLAPVTVNDWTLEDLPERIEGVRQLFLETLADWPDV